MPQFSYKARKKSGESVTGVIDVADRSAALVQIERLGLFPVSVNLAKGAARKPGAQTVAKSDAAGLMPQALREALRRKRKPSMQELATFTQQLANLLHAGMPLTAALRSMAQLQSKGIPPEMVAEIKQDVTEGKSLSDALASQRGIFSDLYINMVRAGEQSGALQEVLQRMAHHYTRFAEVKSKFTSALIYPAFVASVGVAIIFFFMTFMLPKFLQIFEGIDMELPLMTKMLIGMSNFAKSYWWVALAAVLIGLIIWKRFQATPEGRRKIDGWKMRAPIFGHAVRLYVFGQFARTLSTLLENGVPVLTSLKITEDVVPNQIMKEAISRTREEVTDGKTIAQPLASSRIFPQLMIDLIRIGEETGDVPGALGNVADTYEKDLDVALRVMTNMIEPVLIIVMAIGVGFLLLAVLSAMFKMTNSISARG